MLIKNWDFSNPNGETYVDSETNITYSHTNLCDTTFLMRNQTGGTYQWVYAEVDDLTGIPGQGTSNPVSDFYNHQLIKIKFGNLEKLIYDPSYGETYESVLNFENNAIDGFCIPMNTEEYLHNELDENTDLDGDDEIDNKVVGVYRRYFRKNKNEITDIKSN